MTRFAFVGLVLVLLTGAWGCGGAMATRRPDPIPSNAANELDAHERTIVDEQEILEATEPAACPERCRSVEAICEASARICEIAGELGDDGTSMRCTRAERACDEARAGTDSGCGCASSASVELAHREEGGGCF